MHQTDEARIEILHWRTYCEIYRYGIFTAGRFSIFKLLLNSTSYLICQTVTHQITTFDAFRNICSEKQTNCHNTIVYANSKNKVDVENNCEK